MIALIKQIAEKCTSGRFLLTVICGGVFAYAVHAKLIDSAAVVLIIREVFTSYFGRSDRPKVEAGTGTGV